MFCNSLHGRNILLFRGSGNCRFDCVGRVFNEILLMKHPEVESKKCWTKVTVVRVSCVIVTHDRNIAFVCVFDTCCSATVTQGNDFDLVLLSLVTNNSLRLSYNAFLCN